MNMKHVLTFQAASDAVKKEVIIEIDLKELQTLKDNNYRLCFAKRVGDAAFNVVWQSYTKYLAVNKFSWTPQYQLFCSNSFQDKVTVEVVTNTVDIGLGEISTLNEAGILSSASTGGEKTSLNMGNEYGEIHPGVNQLSTGIDGKQISTPIYVAVNASLKGSVSLTPKEQILVWFQTDVETSTMFSEARTNAAEIDLTNVNSAKRLYKEGGWVTPND